MQDISDVCGLIGVHRIPEWLRLKGTLSSPCYISIFMQTLEDNVKNLAEIQVINMLHHLPRD